MTELTEIFNDALVLAARLHKNQKRKDSERKVPYLSHLLRVAGFALEYNADEETAIAALLHDAVEDQGGMKTANLIRKQFGDKVVEIVLECSDSLTQKNQGKLNWASRKERYIDHFYNRDQNNPASKGAVLVCSCDKLDNMSCSLRQLRLVGTKTFELFTQRREGFFWYYRTVLAALKFQNSPLMTELEFYMNEIERITCEAIPGWGVVEETCLTFDKYIELFRQRFDCEPSIGEKIVGTIK